MGYHYIWISSDPVVNKHLQLANEARSAAFYAAIGAVGRAISAIGGSVSQQWARWQRRQRVIAAARELNGLDDHSLKDIGVARGEILSIAEAHGDGVEEPRPLAAAYDARTAQRAGHWPAWLRGVIHGTGLPFGGAPTTNAAPRAKTGDPHHRKSA